MLPGEYKLDFSMFYELSMWCLTLNGFTKAAATTKSKNNNNKRHNVGCWEMNGYDQNSIT